MNKKYTTDCTNLAKSSLVLAFTDRAYHFRRSIGRSLKSIASRQAIDFSIAYLLGEHSIEFFNA